MEKKSRVHGDLLVGDPRKIETEECKRSEHNDYATTSELKDRQYSGLRHNTVLEVIEFWVVGNLERSIPARDGIPDPHALRTAYEEVFGMEIFDLDNLGG